MNTSFLKKSVLLAATLATASLTMGCAGQRGIPESRRVRQAPMSSAQTGIVVSGASEENILNILKTHDSSRVRVVNPAHGIYEVFSVDQAQVRALIPDANVIVEKNKYVDLTKEQLSPFYAMKAARSKAEETQDAEVLKREHPFIAAIRENQGVVLEGELKTFVDSCVLNNEAAPAVTLTSNITPSPANGLVVDLTEKLELSADQSKSKAKTAGLQYLWIVTRPDDSAQSALASKQAGITVTADTSGLHIFSVVVKDAIGVCDMEMAAFYVTQNDDFNPGPAFDDIMADTIDEKAFWHVFHVGAVESWNKAKGENMVVGVIDSGVDYNHPALSKNILVNTAEIPNNGKDDDNNGFIDDVVGYDFGLDDAHPFDDFGHGTHVAGIAASNIIGAARKAKILTTKFGAGLGFDHASVAGAIKYSVDRGAKVLNMSFGWEEDVAIIRDAINYTEVKNVLVVAASGNDSANNTKVGSFPCNYANKNLISVAASDENNALTFYSNYGANVHLAAPGGSNTRMILSASKKNPKDTQFVGMMGTSMASPLIAGVAAQVWSANPHMTATELRQALIDSGTDSQALSGKIANAKVVNAKAAIAKVTGK